MNFQEMIEAQEITYMQHGHIGSLQDLPGLEAVLKGPNLTTHQFESDDDPILLALHAAFMMQHSPAIQRAIINCDTNQVHLLLRDSVGEFEVRMGGDVLNTLKSRAHVSDGSCEFHRARIHHVPYDRNDHSLGGTTLTLIPKGGSINFNRNGSNGSYPHDDLGIYIEHVVSLHYGYSQERCYRIYPPLADALGTEDSKRFHRAIARTAEDYARVYALEDMFDGHGIRDTLRLPWHEYVGFVRSFAQKRGCRMTESLQLVA